MYVADAALSDLADPEWRRYYELCTLAYQNLSAFFRFATTVLQGLLHMAVRNGVMTVEESRGVLEGGRRKGGKWGGGIGRGEVTSTYKVDLELAMTSPGEAGVAVLVRSLDDQLVGGEGKGFVGDGGQGEVVGEEVEGDGWMFDEFTTLFSH